MVVATGCLVFAPQRASQRASHTEAPHVKEFGERCHIGMLRAQCFSEPVAALEGVVLGVAFGPRIPLTPSQFQGPPLDLQTILLAQTMGFASRVSLSVIMSVCVCARV